FGKTTLTEILFFLVPFVIAVLIDLRSHSKSTEPVSIKDATIWSAIWILCSALFAIFIWRARGAEAASLYATGYIMEKALAVDNLFAFYLIFKSFGLIQENTQHHQHRILYWGILGAIFLRILFLGLGAFVVNITPAILILFGLIVLWTVYKMWNGGDDDEGEVDYTNHWSVRFVKRMVKTNPSIESGRFFLGGVTPLFLCLVCIEACDVVFAFDSMPVIIAVVRDPYLMITASLWAAAGLRSLYFLLVAAQNLFWALDKAVMLLLVFISVKLISAGFPEFINTCIGGFNYLNLSTIEWRCDWHLHVPNWMSLSVVASLLSGGILYSILVPQKERESIG
ncbi:MAG: TerC/Alx family metal homeostasis membrane protein, partial [Pirellula sp.]